MYIYTYIYIYILYNTLGKSVLLKCLITKLELELKYNNFNIILIYILYNINESTKID